jgi:hypothetical protein
VISSIIGNWCDAESEHGDYLGSLIDTYLSKYQVFLGPQLGHKLLCFCFVRSVQHLVMSHEHADIVLSIELFKKYKAVAGRHSLLFMAEVEGLFNYKRFTAKGKKWNAYALCRKSKARICPYCNHAYAFTVQGDNGDFRPTLDHFYLKDEYPHLALTLYNLVPSCSSCNSSLKGTLDFFERPHLHPLFDCENIYFYLSAGGDPLDLEEAIRTSRNNVQVKAQALDACSKSDRSLSTFVINERYDMLSVEAIDFYLAKKHYDEAVINTQFSFSFNEATSLRFNRGDYGSYFLGRMYADIYDSLVS